MKHMALPAVVFDFIKSFRFRSTSLKGEQYTLDFVAGYTSEIVFDFI